MEKIIETKKYYIYFTDTHRLKLPESFFEKIGKKKDVRRAVISKVQKGLRQITDIVTEEDWKKSFDEIVLEVAKDCGFDIDYESNN